MCQPLTQHVSDGRKFLKEKGHEEQGHHHIADGCLQSHTNLQDAVGKQQVVHRRDTDDKQVPAPSEQVIGQIGIAIIDRFLAEMPDVGPQVILRHIVKVTAVFQKVAQQFLGYGQSTQIQGKHDCQYAQPANRNFFLMTKVKGIYDNPEQRTPYEQQIKQNHHTKN